jgi:hypothetical protein
MTIQEFFTSRNNGIDSDQYVGQEGRLWYDPITNTIRVNNGFPGGRSVVGGPGGDGNIIFDGSSSVRVHPSSNVSVTVGGIANVGLFTTQGATLSNVVSLGNIVAVGNIVGSYFIGNGSLLTGLPESYSNANVTAFLPTYTGNLNPNVVSATGNVTANFFIGDGSQLTNLPAGDYSNANVAAFLPTYTGNVTANFFIGDGSQLTNLPAGDYSNANVAAFLPTYTGNLNPNVVSATGNVTANFFIGDGSQLTNLPVGDYSNANVAAFLPTYTGNLANLQGNIITTGNITGSYFFGDGSGLTNINVGNIPNQAGNAEFYLTTDGSNLFWNGALATSLTFDGGFSNAITTKTLDGGGAATDYTGSFSISGGASNSDYTFTLSSLALTGYFNDLEGGPGNVVPPLASSSPGIIGQIAFDQNWFYVCVAENSWKRSPLSTW